MKETIEFNQGRAVLYVRKWDPDTVPQSKYLWQGLWCIHIVKASRNFDLLALKIDGWWVTYTPEQITNMNDTFEFLRQNGTLVEFKQNILRLEAWLQKEGENIRMIGDLIPND